LPDTSIRPYSVAVIAASSAFLFESAADLFRTPLLFQHGIITDQQPRMQLDSFGFFGLALLGFYHILLLSSERRIIPSRYGLCTITRINA
jgi:hypothetical protein